MGSVKNQLTDSTDSTSLSIDRSSTGPRQTLTNLDRLDRLDNQGPSYNRRCRRVRHRLDEPFLIPIHSHTYTNNYISIASRAMCRRRCSSLRAPGSACVYARNAIDSHIPPSHFPFTEYCKETLRARVRGARQSWTFLVSSVCASSAVHSSSSLEPSLGKAESVRRLVK